MADKYRSTSSFDYRRFKPEVVLVVLLAVSAVVVAVYLYLDLNRSRLDIDSSKNQAVLSTVSSSGELYKTINEDIFTIDVPDDWIQVNNPEVIVNGSRFYPYRFQGLSGNHIGRRVDVYVNEIPKFLAVNKVVEVNIVDGNYIVANRFSPQCYKFTDFPEDRKGEKYTTNWEGHNFICSTLEFANNIAALETNLEDGFVLSNDESSHKFLLVFTDHGSRPENNIFINILERFRLR